MSVVTFKFNVEENGKLTGDIRRVTLKAPVSLETLRSAAEDILGWKNVAFRFKDEDGDNVTIASQHELDTAISLAQGGPVRLCASQQVQKAEEKAEPVPVAAAAEPEPAPEPAPAPAAEPAPAPAPAAAPAPAVPVNYLENAPDATIPENVMVQFSAIAEFFQRICQQMADFAPRIPVILNEGIRKMSDGVQNNFNPLDVSVNAARNAPADAAEVPEGGYNVVVHRLPECIVHPGIECAHCHKKPLTGMRYRCVQCDCDLCQDCIVIPDVHEKGHRFLPICAPAVGSHLVNSASEACQSVKAAAAPVVQSVVARAAPVVESVKAAAAPVVESVKVVMDDTIANVSSKSAEISEQIKKQVEAMKKEATDKKVAEPAPAAEPAAAAAAPAPAPAPAQAKDGISKAEHEMLDHLEDMGFHDKEHLLQLIRKHKKLDRVIEELIH